MPFVSWEQVNAASDLVPGLLPNQPLPGPSEPQPGALDVMSAALRQHNLVSAAMESLYEPGLPSVDPNYDPTNDLAGFEDWAMQLRHVGSPAEMQRAKNRILAEEESRKTIEQAGGWGIAASFAAGVLDPFTIASLAIPVAPELAGLSRLGRIGAGVAANAALDVSEEVGLHKLQETRTIGESLFRVGAGALLTGAFGTLATRIPKDEFGKLISETHEELKTVADQQSVGAMRVGGNTTLEDESIDTAAGWFIAKTVGRLSLMNRILTSSTKEARVLAQEIGKFSYQLKKNLRGLATANSVEARISHRELKGRVAVTRWLGHAYDVYRSRAAENTLSFRDFGREVSGAMRRGDVHEIPEAAAVAKRVRKIFDADKADLQKLGVLPEKIDLMGAKSYFPRVYDHAYIKAHLNDLKAVLRDHFASNQVRSISPNGTVSELKILDGAELDAAVEDTVDAIRGTTRGLADLGIVSTPAALKKRILDIPDEILEPFMVSDFEHVMSGYIRSVAPQIEVRAAGFSSMTFDDELKTVADAYKAQRTNMKSVAAQNASAKEEEKILEDLKGIIARVTNQLGPTGKDVEKFVNAAKFIRSYNYVTKLGAQTLSSLSDYGHVMTRYGLTRTLARTARFLGSINSNKLIRADAKRMGTAIDWYLDTRGGTLADIGDELGGSKMQVGARWATQRFTRLSGMATWNSAIKAISSSLEQDAMLRAVQKLGAGKLGKYEMAKFAQHGIGTDEMKRIGEQFAKFGEDTDGLFRARTDLWDDREMAKLFETTIVKVGHIMSVTKSAGDLPLFMNYEAARTLFQFKSFGMASINNILIPVAQGLSHGDAATANGLAMMFALGGMTYALKELAAGREPDLSPGRLSRESLNWSGVLGYLPDVWDPLTLALPKAWRESARFSQFKDVSAAQTIAGPTFGFMTDMAGLLAGTSDAATGGGLSQQDIHNLRKALVPLQNVFYLRRLVNAIEGEVGEAVGAEGATHKTFGERITQTDEPRK